MPLIDDVSTAIADAMRRQETGRLSALRMLKAALMNREVEKKRVLDDAESRQVVHALVKQRRDAIEQFKAGGRQDLADKEAAEIPILETYLPPATDPAAIDAAVQARDHRDRGHVAQRHGARDEGRDGAPRRPDG